MAEPAPKRPPAGSVRVALLGNVAGNTWVNRFWLKTTMSGTPTAAQVKALSDAVSAAFRTRFGPQVCTDWHLTTQRTVLYFDSTTEVGVDGSDTGNGSSSGATYPQQCAYLVNWSISGTYRGGHPRTYLAGVGNDNISSAGVLNSTKLSAMNTAIGNYLSDVNALSPTGFSAVTLGTFRFFRNHSAVDPPVFEPFTAGSCHPRLATQRRRAHT